MIVVLEHDSPSHSVHEHKHSFTHEFSKLQTVKKKGYYQTQLSSEVGDELHQHENMV